MYMHGLKAVDCGCKHSGLSGMGNAQSDSYAKTAASLVAAYYTGGASGAFMGAGGGGGGGGESAGPQNQNTNVVTTSTNTQISPSISPNFIQQQQPTNSAVNAATSSNPSQTLPSGIPTVPMTGMVPGIDNMPPSYPILAPTASTGFNKETLIYGALGALGIALVVKYAKRKKAA